ncbi:MAG: hypothetical protein MSIBF_03265 [Candidatus Altiarchaeales archaeon IMC4]|nr:MAG: hypothetical protein MSIBF_03265 [Candidatus Altiarchaeales archaeon IMC4]
MPGFLIKNCRIVSSEGVVEADILVEGEKVAKIGKGMHHENTIDAKNNLVLPGLIDAHVHFREPGAGSKEDWLTGSSAAAAGGVTCVLDMPNTQPPMTTVALLNEKRKIASSKSVVDFGFHFGASGDNLLEIAKADNIASVKYYLGSTTGSLLIDNDACIIEGFEAVAKRGTIATVHAEDESMIKRLSEKLKAENRTDALAHNDSRPPVCAASAVNRMVFLSENAKNRLHICHVTSRAELDVLEGHPKVTKEATPHHLFLNQDDVKRLGNFAKTNPPLRSKEDQKYLWDSVVGGKIDIIASDHAPHLKRAKEADVWSAPSGVPGIETMLPLLLNAVDERRIRIEQVAGLVCENPAWVFGIKGKGRIAQGYDADLVIIDMNMKKRVEGDKLFTKCGWSPFEGVGLKGWPVKTFVRGNLVFDEGNINKMHGKEVTIT